MDYRTDKFRFQPEPAYHPKRDFEYHSELVEIERVARLLGITLMPWQRRAIDVATQYKLDDRGRRVYKYAQVLITVPRQSGKTTLMGPVQIHRMMTRGGPAACWYTAQSGQDARKRMIELIELVEGSPMKSIISSQRSNGGEGIKLMDKPGCHVTRFSPTFSALHGEHPHLVSFDEIWHYDEPLGEALLGAAEPAQITLGKSAQVWLFSTMGTLESAFMNKLVESGRTGADPALCYIEYSLPDGKDPFDPAVWWTYHPALGNTIDEEALQVRADKAKESLIKRATFIRAYGNRLGGGVKSIIDLADYDALSPVASPPVDRSQSVLAYEVAPDSASATVMTAWFDVTGAPAFEIYRSQPGTAWVAPLITKLKEKWECEVVADGAGPSKSVTTKLINDGLTPRELSMSEYGQATEGILSLITIEKTLRLPATSTSETIREQLAVAQAKTTNGVRRFDRDKTPVPIDALIAATVALYALLNPEQEKVSEAVAAC